MCCPVDNLHYWTQPNRLRTTICNSAQTLTVSPAAGAESRGPDNNLHSCLLALYRGWWDKIEPSQRVILNIGHYEMKVALLPLFCWCFIVMLIHLLIWQEEIWIHCIRDWFVTNECTVQAPARRSHQSVLIIRVRICQQVRESVHGVSHTSDSETNPPPEVSEISGGNKK